MIRALALAGMLAATPALAQTAKVSVGTFGSNSKDPIYVEADRLDVFDRESRAVYSGKVLASQGDTRINAAEMIVFYSRAGGDKGKPAKGAPPPASAPPPQGGSGGAGGTAIRRIEAKGGVTVVSKDQVATGRDGVFDRVANTITLTGDVALSQGQNVTRGEQLVYDLNTGVAVVTGGRVKGLFIPGSTPDAAAGPGAAKKKRPVGPKPL